VLLASNHQSYLDPLLISIACSRQLRALARHQLFFWPLSWVIRTLGAVPIDRERGAMGGIKAALKILRDGDALIVFPEGTRTPHGKLQPLHPGFCMLARRSGATIVPVTINGAFAAMPRGSVFPRPTTVTLTFNAPITRDQYQDLGDEQLVDVVRQRIQGQLNVIGREI
jgi:1-acyl-sn-glycerol-3-phosphate acyltransferase